MDRFAVNELRMLYYHRVLLDQLGRTPALRERALSTLDHMKAGGDPHGVMAEWAALLAGDPVALAAAVLADTPRGGLLRANSPLAEALSGDERNALWQRVGLQQFAALFLEAADDLGLSSDERAAVLGLPVEEACDWNRAPPLTMTGAVLDGCKQVLAVHRALARLFPDREGRRQWLLSSVDGLPARPVDLLTQGRGEAVQAYLTRAVQPLLGAEDVPSH
ncbi:MAG: hypothetical protein ACM31L_10720 [Actinomycetota bacterium]